MREADEEREARRGATAFARVLRSAFRGARFGRSTGQARAPRPKEEIEMRPAGVGRDHPRTRGNTARRTAVPQLWCLDVWTAGVRGMREPATTSGRSRLSARISVESRIAPGVIPKRTRMTKPGRTGTESGSVSEFRPVRERDAGEWNSPPEPGSVPPYPGIPTVHTSSHRS